MRGKTLIAMTGRKQKGMALAVVGEVTIIYSFHPVVTWAGKGRTALSVRRSPDVRTGSVSGLWSASVNRDGKANSATSQSAGRIAIPPMDSARYFIILLLLSLIHI